MSTETKVSGTIDVSIKTIVHVAIMCLFMFCFRFLPTFSTVTEYGMAVLGVFLGLIYGWSFVGLMFPTLLGIFGLALTGYGTVEQVTIAMFSNSSILMMIFGSLCFMVLMQSKAADYIMAKIIGSNLAKKSPMYTVMIILGATLLINNFGGNMVFYFGIFPIMVSTLKKVGYPIGDKFSVMFLTGFMACIQLGLCFRPFVGWGIMTVGTMMQLTQSQISYGGWMIIMAVVDIAVMVSYPFFMKLVGCDFKRLADVDIAQAFGIDTKQKLNLTQKIVLFSMGVFLFIVIVFSVAGSKLGALNTFYLKISVIGMMILFWIVMTVIKIDGKPLLNLREASTMFTWDMLLLVAIALLISSVLTSTETGISMWISSLLGPIFAGRSPVVFLIFLALLTLVLTNFANNIAICYIMMNVTAAMYLNGLPVNILAASLIIAVFSVLAFLTPASSMPGAMLHACEVLTPKAIYQIMPLILVYFLILCAFLFIAGGLIFS